MASHSLTKLAAGFTLLCLPFTASLGVDPGWYGNLGFGVSEYSEDELNAVCGSVGLTCTSDNQDSTFKAALGRKFNPYLGFEIGYSDYGKVTISPGSLAGIDFETDGFYGAFIGEIPFGQGGFSLLGELGLIYISGKLTANLPGLGAVASIDDSTGAAVYGLGAAFNSKSGKFSLRLLWERVDFNEDFTISGTSFDSPVNDVVTLSAIFRLGQ